MRCIDGWILRRVRDLLRGGDILVKGYLGLSPGQGIF